MGVGGGGSEKQGKERKKGGRKEGVHKYVSRGAFNELPEIMHKMVPLFAVLFGFCLQCTESYRGGALTPHLTMDPGKQWMTREGFRASSSLGEVMGWRHADRFSSTYSRPRTESKPTCGVRSDSPGGYPHLP